MSNKGLILLLDMLENLCGLVRETVVESYLKKELSPQDLEEIKVRINKLMSRVWWNC